MNSPTKTSSSPDIQRLTTVFIGNLMRFPGCFLRCPMPLYKGQHPEEWEKLKQDICRSTSEILLIMGIKHSVLGDKIMVEIDQ